MSTGVSRVSVVELWADLRASLIPTRAADRVLLSASPWSLPSLGLLYFMILPVSQNGINAVLLLVALLTAAVSLARHGWRASRSVTVAGGTALVAGVVAAGVGAMHANPGIKQEVVFFVVLPAVFLALIASAPTHVLASGLAAIPIGMAVLSTLAVLYFAAGKDLLPIPESVFGFLGAGGAGQIDPSVPELGSRIRFYAIPTLAFGLPYLAAVALLGLKFASRAANWCVWPGLVLGGFFLLISGRRAVIVTCVVAVVAVAVAAILLRRSDRRRDQRQVAPLNWGRVAVVAAGSLAVLVGVAYVAGFSPAAFVSALSEAPDSPRPLSQAALLRGWAESPILGQGLGYVADVVRNLDAPWQYEVQYHLILAVFGVVPGLLLLMPTAWLLAAAAVAGTSRRHHGRTVLAVLAGTGCVLVANASNPYLHTAGQYWMFFILVFAVDVARRHDPEPSSMSEAATPGLQG